MKDDSWGRARGEKNGYYGGSGEQEEAVAQSVAKSPDVLGGKVGEDEVGLNFEMDSTCGRLLALWQLELLLVRLLAYI